MDLSGVLSAGGLGGARQIGLDGYRQACLLAFVTGYAGPSVQASFRSHRLPWKAGLRNMKGQSNPTKDPERKSEKRR
jgi:hypothetical protein